MKSKALFTGILAVASPIPMILFTMIWYWIWFFGIGMGMMNYNTVPQWINILGLLPLFVSPCIGIGGIVYGCIRIKQKRAWLGVLLSALGLIENLLLLYGIIYIGSRY